MPAASPAAGSVRTATMRSAIVAEPGVARVESVSIPEPGPGEIRVRLEGSGVCGSNLPFWEGRPWFTYPGEPGAPPGEPGAPLFPQNGHGSIKLTVLFNDPSDPE